MKINLLKTLPIVAISLSAYSMIGFPYKNRADCITPKALIVDTLGLSDKICDSIAKLKNKELVFKTDGLAYKAYHLGGIRAKESIAELQKAAFKSL